ncbi:MAG: alpha/beta hydrolase [Acidobacteriota bacterium]
MKFFSANLSCILLIAVLSFFISAGSLWSQEEELHVLERWIKWSDAENLLQHHLNSLAFELLAARKQKIQELDTAREWSDRQAEVKLALEEIIGPFPSKTPLNPRIVGKVTQPGYRIEKIVFESRPDFYVTGCLFIPEGVQESVPAILNVIGHTGISFRAPSYQQLILNLVGKGFIVFAMDPIGQGERLQYYDPQVQRSLVGGSTAEHSYLGKQCFLVGSSAAHYFTWDGIRAIDYLVSRPDVDPDRIGVTGISGGGTQTSYIAALDERVLAAAPANYICGFHRLFQSIGPQDAEQNFNRGIAHGIDHADFLEIRAPKPTLVVATTRDFFSIQGARETLAEAGAAFEALGAGQNLSMVEDDLGHGYTQKNREAIYAFFQKHLNHPGDSAEAPVEILNPEELRVTRTGQVIDSLGGETVFSLNRSHAQGLARRLERSRESDLQSHLDRVRTQAREISGFTEPGALSEPDFYGRWNRDGYSIEEYTISGEGGIILPLLLFKPNQFASGGVALYLHPEGKSAEAAPGGEIEGLIKQGYMVLAPDLSGTGELGEVGNSSTFLGVQIGRSIPGIRAADIIRCIRFLRSEEILNHSGLTAIARGGMAVPLLHAALFEPAIANVALIEPLISFHSVVNSRFYEVSFEHLVPNALTAYDLPDLEASLAPRKLLMINVQGPLLTTADSSDLDSQLQVVRKAYSARNADEHLRIHQGLFPDQIEQTLTAWLENLK